MNKSIPRVEFTIDEDDLSMGIKAVSLVDEPAIESNFIYFSKQTKKPKFVKLEKEGYKNTVFGAVLIPDKDIYRVDSEGNEFNGYFSSDTIEKLRNKFHKELQTSNVNEDHNENNFIEAYLNESYIINSEERLKDAETKGLVDITLGTWVAAYKIESDESFQRVLDGELKGFSIEAFLSKEIKKLNKTKNNKNNKNKKMKNNLINRLSKLIAEFSKENFERQSTVDGMMYEWTEVGSPVFKVITNQETQEETQEEVGEGVIEFEDGSSISIDTDGNLVEFMPAPEVTEDEVIVAEKDKDKEKMERAMLEDGETTVEYTEVGSPVSIVEIAEDGSETLSPAPEGMHVLDNNFVIVVDADGNLVEVREMDEDESESTEEDLVDTTQSIADLVDLTKDGFYSIEVSVEGGVITYGAVYQSSYKELELKAEKKFKAEKLKLEKEIEKLNNTPIVKAISDNSKEVKSVEKEIDFSKLTNIQKIALKNKIKL